MNAFEFYFFYFKDSTSFIEALLDFNETALEALEELLKGDKVSFDSEKDMIYERVWSLIRNHESERLQNIFEKLLTQQRFESVKFWITCSLDQNNTERVNLNSSLRIIAASIKVFGTSTANETFFHSLALKLCDLLYRENSFYSGIL